MVILRVWIGNCSYNKVFFSFFYFWGRISDGVKKNIRDYLGKIYFYLRVSLC